jgi:hypothetical protein
MGNNHRKRGGRLAALLLCFGTGCAAAPPTSTVSFAVAIPAPHDEPRDTKPSLPTRSIEQSVATCTPRRGSKVCSVAESDVEQICRAPAAVKAFAAGKTLARAWLRGDVEVWSSVHHARTSKDTARFDEEVLVLAERRARGGIVVTGSAVSYEVLRWNGSCATLSEGEITWKRPPAPGRPVDFAKLDNATREWLASDVEVLRLEGEREAICAPNPFTRACKKASQKRDAALGSFVGRSSS